jgi:predicted MFS family arabinose efflux permease
VSSVSRTRVVIALGTAQTLAWGSSYYLPAILAVPMARELGISSAFVFGAFSASMILSAALGPIAGRAIDRHGGRWVLAFSNLVFAAGLAILGLAQGAVSLAAGWIVIGVGISIGLYEAAFSALAVLYGRDARGPITGITLIAGFASTVGWPLSAVLEQQFGWREACFTWAALHILIGIPLNVFGIPRGTLATSRQGEPLTEVHAPPEPPRHAMPILAIFFSLVWFVTGALAAHLPRLLEVAGATATNAVLAAALIGPAQVAARLAEYGLRRLNPLYSARAATLAHPTGAMLLLVFGAPAAFVFTILHGAGGGILTITRGTLPLAIFGPAGYGLRQGLLGAPTRIVSALAPFIFGIVIDAYGAGALLLTSATSLVALVGLFLLQLPKGSTSAKN